LRSQLAIGTRRFEEVLELEVLKERNPRVVLRDLEGGFRQIEAWSSIFESTAEIGALLPMRHDDGVRNSSINDLRCAANVGYRTAASFLLRRPPPCA